VSRRGSIAGQSEAPQRIGICLSGGGLRASFYALGVLRYLAEAGILHRLATISSISGGSIAAAALADRWGEVAAAGHSLEAFLEHVDRPFRSVVTEKNLRNIWIRRWLTRFWRDRGRVQGTVLADYLYKTRRVSALPSGLQTVITSTDLATGRAFRVCRDFVGSYDFDYVDPPEELELGAAVAASAAFPLVFPPVHLSTEGWGLRDAPPILSLTDGGVYDNLGLEWFQGWDSGRPAAAVKPDFLVVVDASGGFRRTDKRVGEFKALGRVRSIQYRQTRTVRIRWLIAEFMQEAEAGRWHGVYVASVGDPRRYRDRTGQPIDSSLYHGALPSELIGPLAGLRTDLDRFLPEEADLLSYHGYWSTHARLGSTHPDLAVVEPTWREFGELSEPEKLRLKRILEWGRKHLGPGRYLG
jgi:NTE family protein